MPSPILQLLTLTTGQSAKEASINANFEAVEQSMNAGKTLDFTSGNITMPILDLLRYFYFKTSNVSVERLLELPSATRLFLLDNSTGTAAVEVDAGGGTTVIADSGEIVLIGQSGTTLTRLASNLGAEYYNNFRGGQYRGLWTTSDRIVVFDAEALTFPPYVTLGGTDLPTIDTGNPDAVAEKQNSFKIGFCNYLETSSMTFDMETPVGGGDITLRVKFVGTDSAGALRLKVDTVTEDSVSITQDYADLTVALAAGAHTIEIEYEHISASGQTTTGAYVSMVTFDAVAPPDFIAGDTVKYNNQIFMALLDDVLAIPGTDAAKWEALNNPVIPVNDQTGTSYALVLADMNKTVRMDNAAAITLTVPANSTTAFPIGTVITIRQVGAGQITLSPGGGVTLNTPSTLKSRTQFSTLSIHKVDTDEWDVMGDIESL